MGEPLIHKRLQEYEISPNENLGQHFLFDDNAINTIVSQVGRGNSVLEVGPGLGQLTEALARKATQVVAIEVDTKFRPLLNDLFPRNSNVSVFYGDVTKQDLSRFVSKHGDTQVVANLPFHITEPFMGQLVGLPIDSAVLLLGERAVHEFNQSEQSLSFGRLSLLSQTFFNVSGVARISSYSFYPQPRTDCVVIRLDPKSKKEIYSNPADFIFAELFRKEKKHAPVINDLKQALVDLKTSPLGSSSKQEFHQRQRSDTRRMLRRMTQTLNFSNASQGEEKVASQSQALRTIDQMGLSGSVLNKQFHALDNQDIRELTQAVRGLYG